MCSIRIRRARPEYIADKVIEAGWNDRWAAANLARECAAVTLEIEQVSLVSLEEAARWAPVRPGAAMMGVIQDRIEQKDWLRKHSFPTGPVPSRAFGGADGRGCARARRPSLCQVSYGRV